VNVRVNETGKNIFPLRINDFRPFWRRDVSVNARDGFVFAKDVRKVAGICCDDFTVFY
jgi:hypothetical protein